jgi:hypothetical protein
VEHDTNVICKNNAFKIFFFMYAERVRKNHWLFLTPSDDVAHTQIEGWLQTPLPGYAMSG